MATTNKLMSLRSGTAGTSGVLAISSTSASVDISAGLTKSEDSVRLVASVDCFVRGTTGAGTAVTTDMFLAAGMPEGFGLHPDMTHINAVTASGSGNLYWSIHKGA